MSGGGILRLLCGAAGALFLLGAAPARALPLDPAFGIVGLSVAEGVGWHAEQDIRLQWSGVAGRPDAQVRAVGYRVRDVSGQVVIPTQRSGISAANRLLHVFMPPIAGEYTVEVWLEGETAEGPPSLAHARFDPERPPPSRPLVPSGWVRAGVPIAIGFEHPAWPWPLSGIRGYAVAVDRGAGVPPCAGQELCTPAETDLHAGADGDSIAIDPLLEGTSYVRVYAVSGSGVRSAELRSAELHADGTGPAVAFAAVPGGWSDRPIEVTAEAADELAGMAAGGVSAARTAIAVDNGTAHVEPGPVATTVVHGAGVHRLSASAIDAVGNPTSAPAEAVVRIDEAPPQLAFAPAQDPSEPERIEALLSDGLSGPDPVRSTIAVRAAGSRGPFASLPTRYGAGRLTANWDSDPYPPGEYEFEAIGYDAAGNRALTKRRAGGAPMVLSAPLKTGTALVVGFGGRRALVQSCSHTRGEVHCQRRAVGPYDRRPPWRSARFGLEVQVGGRLSDLSGTSRGGEMVSLVEELDDGTERTSTARTAADGTFLIRLSPGPSRRIRVEFAGTRQLGRSRSRTLRLAVRPLLRLRTSAPTAVVGGTPLLFSGVVGPSRVEIPEAGLPVTMQFRIREGRWEEFRTVQTDGQGRFRYPYAFTDDDSRGVRFQFRALVDPQPGWPYAGGVSAPVLVSGR